MLRLKAARILLACLTASLIFFTDGFLQQRQHSLLPNKFRRYGEQKDTATGERANEVLNIFKEIIEPGKGIDLVSASLIKKLVVSPEGDVRFQLDLNDGDIKSMCVELISTLSWVRSVKIEDSVIEIVDSVTPEQSSVPKGLNGVKHIIAVSSCKGGVGKSTTSVNLAYTLHKAGASVGILDADIYGPSLPTMTKPENLNLLYDDGGLQPLEFNGVKLMSMGFINKGAAIMRGPMVNQILNQFVSLCNWGTLDYLIVDMPPGTGDIQLTLSQIMNISAAVIVTTPQRLSFVDVVKGIDLFDTVNVPCVAVVENMAEYSTYSFDEAFFASVGTRVASAAAVALSLADDDENGGEEDALQAASEKAATVLRQAIEASKRPLRIFGEGHTQRLKDMWGIDNLISIPLVEQVSDCGDAGTPYVLRYPDSPVASSLVDLATGVVRELEKLAKAGMAAPKLSYEQSSNSILFEDGEDRTEVSPFALRCGCRCAVCVEEFTGRRLLDLNAIPKDIRPLKMAPIGRYAMSIDWSDGHKSLMPFRQISLVGP